ncbi:DUF397 domain-containing protein [Pseudonocardia acaciae]|uniref:DUF397 domain-containing protein n=1 Tax=Pseudonocardia acaciae TaxID=551276 RepID=UPI00049133E8|nr:DUF397 domain-containing protein [Pseudonocardia acaciae]
MAALRAGDYVKSSFSSESRAGDCVMLCTVDGWIGMQDSKQYPTTPPAERTTLGFTKAEFAAFLTGVKAGEFDHPST